jgi:hypothetical protein
VATSSSRDGSGGRVSRIDAKSRRRDRGTSGPRMHRGLRGVEGLLLSAGSRGVAVCLAAWAWRVGATGIRLGGILQKNAIRSRVAGGFS